uniref:Ig-like domain-containing protein n=1 Tax=Leptobrachium leishanense TaxID=445787 RepID=A0A8C5MAS5_9ANUR
MPPMIYLGSGSCNIVSGQNVIQSPPELTVNEGMDVALSCHADVAVTSMAWYIQKPGQTPQYLLQEKLSTLSISNLKITDSATYWCALEAQC